MPTVSFGMPVFNGEKYIEEAIESILSQTFDDFEFIICDNASTDRTKQICKNFQSKDKRIEYYRNENNIGAAANFNKCFKLSKGKYFKWAAHDDVIAPDYLKECIKVLENDISVVLCHTDAEFIDSKGQFLCSYKPRLKNISSFKKWVRFRDLISLDHYCIDIFGVIRSEVLSKTKLIDNYIESDRTLFVEIGLEGRFYRIPKILFYSREHAERSVRAIDLQERGFWWNPVLSGRIFLPRCRLPLEYIKLTTTHFFRVL